MTDARTRYRLRRAASYLKARRRTHCTWREPTGRPCTALAVTGTLWCLLHTEAAPPVRAVDQ